MKTALKFVRGKAPRSSDEDAPKRGSLHWEGPVPRAITDPPIEPLPYRSRRGEVKCAVHWGQRKLLMSELQMLLPPVADGFRSSYHIVYVGSAPGSHLPFLDDLFLRRHTWQLVDPGAFDDTLRGRPNFRVENRYFTNDVAYEILVERVASTCPALAVMLDFHIRHGPLQDVPRRGHLATGDLDSARMTEDIPVLHEPVRTLPLGLQLLTSVAAERRPLLFISDIRTGTAAMPNFAAHVVENMMAQATWFEILQANFGMLKFRLPYSTDRWHLPNYLEGEMLLPIWGPLTTTECRLIVRNGAKWVVQNAAAHEDRMFYFNAMLRERVHFNHQLSPHAALDNRFDSAAEVKTWQDFLASAAEARAHADLSVEALVDVTSTALGESFEDARRKRDALLAASTTVDGGTEKRYRPQQKGATNDGKTTHTADVLRERSRAIWWSNVVVRGGGMLPL
jgi:cap3/cap4 methyltransferase